MTRAPGLVLVAALLIAPAHQAKTQGISGLAAEQEAAEAICEKQVVVLGELPSHGEARAFQAKARMVEALVTRCGFGAVLFEAPVYDFLGLQEALAEDRAVPAQLDRAIGGFWLTRGLSGWRQWLFSRAVEGHLLIGGLDDQVSATSDFARATLPELVADLVPFDNQLECREAVSRNLYWQYDAERPFDEAERSRLQQCGRLAANALGTRTDRYVDTPSKIMVENLANLFDRQQQSASARDRDEMMFRNVVWQVERLPADSKIIIWTATVHAARQQGDRPDKPLGTWLSEQWTDRLAVVGFTALAGESSMAGMPAKPLPETPPGSLEALATQSDTAWVYLNASALHEMGVVPSRLFGRITSADWSTLFDAVLVIREEVAPVFEPR